MMTGELTKNYSFGTIVMVADLLLLDKYIKSIYPFITYQMKVSNGANYTLNSIEEMLEYDNPNSRKITGIYFYASKHERVSMAFSDFELSVVSFSPLFSSISYAIRRASQEEINAYSNKIQELVDNFRAPYNWISTPIIPCICGVLLSIIVGLTITELLAGLVDDKTALWLLQVVISLICGLLGLFLYKKWVLGLYPMCVFRIGKQIEVNEQSKRLRYTIGIVVILGVVVSIVASLIVHYILNF